MRKHETHDQDESCSCYHMEVGDASSLFRVRHITASQLLSGIQTNSSNSKSLPYRSRCVVGDAWSPGNIQQYWTAPEQNVRLKHCRSVARSRQRNPRWPLRFSGTVTYFLVRHFRGEHCSTRRCLRSTSTTMFHSLDLRLFPCFRSSNEIVSRKSVWQGGFRL